MPKNVTVFRRTILIAIMFVILFSGHTHLGLAEAPVTILKFDGTERTVTTELSDPCAVFKEAGIAVGQADRIEEKTSGRGKVLVLKRAVPVIVVRGDSQQKFFTNKDTVGEALKELNIRFNKKRVYPAADTPVTANVEIHILNKGDTLSSVEADSEIPVKYIDDENIPYGQEQLVEQGKAGKVKVVKKISGKHGQSTQRSGNCPRSSGRPQIFRYQARHWHVGGNAGRQKKIQPHHYC